MSSHQLTKNLPDHINSVMEITGLSNVEVDIRGALLWSTDIPYWLENSLPMGYQNHSTAFIFGGDRVHMYSSTGKGTFDGNGQVW
jgi:galacturan 1,4-alpha-galacturonidase